jgi:hypothetical protein
MKHASRRLNMNWCIWQKIIDVLTWRQSLTSTKSSRNRSFWWEYLKCSLTSSLSETHTSRKFMRKWQRKCLRSHVSLHRREESTLKRRDTCTQFSSDRSSHTNSARDTHRTNARTRSWNSSRISSIFRSRIYTLFSTHLRRFLISFKTSKRRYHSLNYIWHCCKQRHEWDYTRKSTTFLRKHIAIKSNAS